MITILTCVWMRKPCLESFAFAVLMGGSPVRDYCFLIVIAAPIGGDLENGGRI